MKRRSNAAKAAATAVPEPSGGAERTGDAWEPLLRQWQEAAAQWTSWWTTAAGASLQQSPAQPPPAQLSAWSHPPQLSAQTPSQLPAQLPPLPAQIPSVTFDPIAVGALTEKYAGQFELLWVRALAHAGIETAASANSAARAEGNRDVPASDIGSNNAPIADRRFAGKAWQEPYFAWLKDAYLVYGRYVQDVVALAQADAAAKARLAFVARQLLDAIAPTNFLATNPEAIELAMATGGGSVALGVANLIADTQRGRIAMSDESAFHVGRNLAITPGSVVFRNPLIELIQFAPSTPKVFKRPLLIVPPCINKYYILDLQPDNSFVRYAVAEGHTVFIVSWRNVPAELGSLTWDDYVEQGVLAAIKVAREISGSGTINTLGFCVGGTLLACALAVLAARHDNSVASTTLLTTMLDFADPGEIGVYVSPESLASREPTLCAGGRVQGSELANAFASLRANELVWNYVVGNYLKGQTPPAFDLLYWNGDSTNLPGPMYVEYIRDMYIENRLREPRALTMCGEAIDLGRISMPAYVYASRDDHIVPWRTAYRNVGLLGGDVTFALGASGHIAGVINPPAKRRRNFWTNELLTDAANEWLARAESQPGSWWPHWSAWAARYGGARRAAPKDEGSRAYPTLGRAPGEYVKEGVAADSEATSPVGA